MSLTRKQRATVEAVLEAHLGRCVQSFLDAACAPPSADRYARFKDGDPLRNLEHDLNRAADAAASAVDKLGIFAEGLRHDLRKALRQVIYRTVDVASLAQLVRVEPANG